MSASRPAKYREWAARISDASPRATSCSSANWRIVSSIENRVRPDDRSATSSDLRTSASSRSRMAKSSGSSGIPRRRRRFARSNPPANTEHRSSSAFSGVVEQVVGPRHGVAQGVVAFQAAPRARPAAGTDDRDDHAPRWRSSTPSARPPTRWPTGSRRGGGRSPPPRPPRQRRPPRSAAQRLRARSTNRATAAESMPAPTSSEGTGHSCSSATPSPSRLVARNLHGRRVREDGLDQIGGGVEHVLAVVEHQQPDPALQRGGHALAHALAGLLGDAQHRRHRVGHRRRIGDRGQLEKPDPVREFIGQPRRDFQRQPGLADPAHPGQRHQPMSLAPPLAPRRPRTRAR